MMNIDEIATADISKIIQMLIADELLAAAQYKTAHIVATGKAFEFADKIFLSNGDEEYDDHVEELVDFAQSMDIPVEVNPSQVCTNCSTPYVDVATIETTEKLVSLLLESEKRAIEVYEAAAKSEAGRQYPSFAYMCAEIAKDERNHKKKLNDVMSQISGCSGIEALTSDDGCCGTCCSDSEPTPLEQATDSLAAEAGGIPAIATGMENIPNEDSVIAPHSVKITIMQHNDEEPIMTVAEESTVNEFVSMRNIAKQVFESFHK